MATASVTASLRGRYGLVCWFIFLRLFQHATCYTPETLTMRCRDTFDLRGANIDSGLLVSELPDRIPIYPNEDQYCDYFLTFAEGSEMMFYFDQLDLHSSGGASRCDSTNVEFFDGSDNMRVKGLEGQVCGRQEEMPTGVYYVLNNMLIIRANSMGVVQGSGFRIHFTVYRKGFPCNREEFSCEDYDAHSGGAQGFKRCVDRELVCDDWNDCGDWADEKQNCNDLSVGAIIAIVLVALGLIALIVGLIIFCKIRRDREMKRIGEKEAAVMRDTSFSSSRAGGMMSPFSISNETLEKDKYTPRYATGRNSSRRGQGPARAPDYEEHPPPYTEKPSLDHSRSDDGLDEDRPRSRRKRQDREADEVFDDEGDLEEEPRMRRGRSRSQDERLGSSAPRDDRYLPRDDRQPYRRDEQDSPRFDRYSRDPDDRRPARDDRYPSRRDDQDSPPTRRDDRDRPPSRHDQRDRDRERDRDRPPSRYDDRDRERDRDRPQSRYDERDRDRPPSRYDERDRDRDPRRERPTSGRGPPDDRYSYGEDDMMDQLHPLREIKRRSMHTDSDPDISREDRGAPRDRPRDDDRYPSRDDRRPRDSHPRDRGSDLHPPRGRDDRSSPRGSDREDRPPPRDRDERPRDRNGPRGSSRDDRPERPREGQSPHQRHPSRNPDDSYEDVRFPDRRSRRDSPPPPAAEDDPEDSPPRHRRRRSRSRDGQDRPRSSRYADDDRAEGGRGRGGGEEEGRRSRVSYGGFKEQSV